MLSCCPSVEMKIKLGILLLESDKFRDTQTYALSSYYSARKAHSAPLQLQPETQSHARRRARESGAGGHLGNYGRSRLLNDGRKSQMWVEHLASDHDVAWLTREAYML